MSRFLYVVDDDREVRVAISLMLKDDGLQARPFASGVDLLENLDDLQPGVILLDMRMPQMDAFQVMDALIDKGTHWPVIVMTGHGDVGVAVRAMKLGAVDFLEKPFGTELLNKSLEPAFAALVERTEKAERDREAKARIALLSGREKEILSGLLAGFSNKVLAQRLDISLRTVEMHRANMMARLTTASLAEALVLAIAAGLPPLERRG